MAHVNDIDTLAELTRFHARERGEQGRVPLRRSRSTTYRQFDELTNRVANGLLAEGLTSGSRVGFLDKNSDLFYQLVFGAAKAGAVSVGINWRLAPPEVAYILNDSRAEVLCVGPDFFGLVAQIKDELTHVKQIIAMSPRHDDMAGFFAVARRAIRATIRRLRLRPTTLRFRCTPAARLDIRRACSCSIAVFSICSVATERRHAMERLD